MSPPTRTAEIPTTSETREPKMTRASTSRPRWSVPRRCARPSAPSRVGGLRRARSDCRSGSWTTQGATTASTARKATTPSPSRMSHGMRRPRGRVFCIAAKASSAGAGAGIEEAIEKIDGEVDDDEHHRGEEDRALHHGIVAIVDGLHGEPANAGPGKDGLRHHRPPQERTPMERGGGANRTGGVTEGVLGHHDHLAEPLGSRRADVVGAEHLEHGRAREARDRGHGEGAEGEGGQHEVLPAAPPRGGEEIGLEGEEQDEEDAEEEGWRRLADQGESHGRVVEDGVALHGGEEPDGHRHERREEKGGETQLEGRGNVAAHHGKSGLAEVQGAAEVELQGVTEKDRVLDGERAIEPELAAHALHLADGSVGGQEERHGVAGKPHDDEDDGGDEPEGDQGAEEPLDDEREKSAHGEAPSVLPSPRAGRGQEQGRLYARRNLKLKRRISNC